MSSILEAMLVRIMLFTVPDISDLQIALIILPVAFNPTLLKNTYVGRLKYAGSLKCKFIN
jgi:hypothetical protein